MIIFIFLSIPVVVLFILLWLIAIPKTDLDTVIVILSLVSLILSNLFTAFPNIFNILTKNISNFFAVSGISFLICFAVTFGLPEVVTCLTDKELSGQQLDTLIIARWGYFILAVIMGGLYWLTRKSDNRITQGLLYAFWWFNILLLYIWKIIS